jgi:gluconokinase
LFWFRDVYSQEFHRARHWMSFGEYFFLKVLGKPACSTSMASGTGLWQQNQNQYDSELLELIGLKPSHFADPATMDEPARGLLPEYRTLWPLFDGIPWFPAYGDGACNNIGSGCVSPERFCLMVGTSGAMRAVFEAPEVEVPAGLWCYRVDRRRFVLGGALSNGGGVYAWMRRALALPPDETLESEMAAIAPGSHGLTILPLFAGERSPKWRGDARATFSGMSLNTRPVEMLRAALESVALRFRSLFDIMRTRLAEPEQVIASGGALLRSATWTQMMADALHRPVLACIEQEASSRGAALLALERLGVIAHVRDLPARTGATFQPNSRHREAYEQMLAAQQRLYRKLYEEN